MAVGFKPMAVTLMLPYPYHVAMGSPGSCPQDAYNPIKMMRYTNSNNMKKTIGVIDFCGA